MHWYNNIWNPKTLIVIFIEFNNRELELSAIRQNKVSLKENQKIKKFDSIKQIIDTFGKNKAYVIHVLGSGVLTRLINFHPNYKEDIIISGDTDDFHFTSYKDDSKVAVSFFRKDLIQQILAEIKKSNIHLLRITAGNIPILLKADSTKIKFDYDVFTKQGEIIDFKKTNEIKEKCFFRDQLISKKELIALCLFENCSDNNPQFFVSENDLFEETKNEYRRFRQFNFWGIASLSTIFAVLILNYFYLNQLNSSINELETQLMISNDNLSLLDRLEQEKRRKENLIVSAGVNSSKFLSYYLDKIGLTVPKNIQLSQLDLFPLVGKLKNKNKIEVDKSGILIEGTTKDNVILDNWIEVLDRFEWVESIQLHNYTKHTDQRSDFKISISLQQ